MQNFLELAVGRIFVYNQNLKLPGDSSLFVVVSSSGSANIISNVSKYDPDEDEDIQYTTLNQEYYIDFYSKNREAVDRKHEFVMALKSTFSIQKQEEYSMKIWRSGQILDLSYIDGVSALHRYRLPVKISYIETKRTAIEPIDKFPPLEVENNE